MSRKVIELVLQSDHLQVRCEEETFFLVIAWINSYSKQNNKFVANHLYHHIRFERFKSDYVFNVVMVLCNGELLGKIMAKVLLNCDIRHYAPPLNRGDGKEQKIVFHVNLCDIIRIEEGNILKIPGGLVLGYPLCLIFKHNSGTYSSGEGSCGMYLQMKMPTHSRLGLDDYRRVSMHASLKIGSLAKVLCDAITEKGRGWDNIFDKP